MARMMDDNNGDGDCDGDDADDCRFLFDIFKLPINRPCGRYVIANF